MALLLRIALAPVQANVVTNNHRIPQNHLARTAFKLSLPRSGPTTWNSAVTASRLRYLEVMAQPDRSILEHALIGFQAQLADIDGKITEIQSQLGGRKITPPSTDGSSARPRRKMSAAGKARIAAAQKARWAAYHKESGRNEQARKTPRKKRVLSAAGRKRIAEATKKRWAAYRAAKAA